MEQMFEKLLGDFGSQVETLKKQLDINMSVLMDDNSQSPEKKQIAKDFISRLNKGIKDGSSKDLTSLKDEVLNQINSK